MFDQQGDQPEKKDIEKENRCEESSDLDDDLLAACINDGIQSNMYDSDSFVDLIVFRTV